MLYYYETGAGFRVTREQVVALRAEAAGRCDDDLIALCDAALDDGLFGDPDCRDAWEQIADLIAVRR
jgi:hypothetical protein